MMMIKAIGALLTYPNADLLAALFEIRGPVQEKSELSRREREALLGLVDALTKGDPYTLQEDYVACFDRGRATSLHLFEHVHGDSRERGQAMIDLREQYLKAGLAINPGELPDYLPAFLEYVAHLPRKEAIAQLRDVVHLLQGIHVALVRRQSPYAAALAALIVLAGSKPEMPARDSRPVAEPTQEEIDAEWEEQPAFGPARPGACGADANQSGGVQPLHFIPKPAAVQPGAMR